jgi:hypothetical protein
MFIYNITIKVNKAISAEWLKWQLEDHTPEIMATELFTDYKFFHLLDQDDAEGPTFVFQYYTEDRKNYDRYVHEYAPILREKAFKKWGHGFIAFRSLLQSVQ